MALTVERVRQAISYDPATGICTWLIITGKARKGCVAGHARKDGYITISLDREANLAHRLIYFWMTGEWPEEEIDHKDRDRANNKWDNLRPATSTQNKANTPAYKNNVTGFKGVYPNAGRGKPWLSTIRVNRKTKYLGKFDTVEEARAAYRSAAIEAFGFFHST